MNASRKYRVARDSAGWLRQLYPATSSVNLDPRTALSKRYLSLDEAIIRSVLLVTLSVASALSIFPLTPAIDFVSYVFVEIVLGGFGPVFLADHRQHSPSIGDCCILAGLAFALSVLLAPSFKKEHSWLSTTAPPMLIFPPLALLTNTSSAPDWLTGGFATGIAVVFINIMLVKIFFKFYPPTNTPRKFSTKQLLLCVMLTCAVFAICSRAVHKSVEFQPFQSSRWDLLEELHIGIDYAVVKTQCSTTQISFLH